MNIDRCVAHASGLWPGSDWTEQIHSAFWGRAVRLNLTDEQVFAVLDEYRMHCRYKSPNPGELLGRLKVAAGGDTVKSRVRSASEYEPTPLSGPAIGFREFCRRKAKLGEPVHLMLAEVFGRTSEENERRRADREKNILRRFSGGGQ